ncbi:MAG: MBL fold metallo-hydrolase [Treponema sp.]|jgi:phosphoribosyl 1,2-cyclic phosphate phosphodiesterase|nr:MBL fold metallo-hydrolase [Treponema sp.]
MKLTVLGSGTSHGIPVVGCLCAVCRSEDPRDKRMRASLYVEGEGGETAVIDTGPEFRLQALRADIRRLDAVFFTHAHADHIHGLDDVRSLSVKTPLPVYGDKPTIREIRKRFSYIFKNTQRGGGKPRIIPAAVSAPLAAGGLRFTPVPVKHGALDILGWRIDEAGKTAVYLTDASAIPPASLPLIAGADILIIGALREQPHETHFNFEQALHTAAGLRLRQVFLTHICHDYTHREIEAYCRNFILERELTGITIGPAWDGLELSV